MKISDLYKDNLLNYNAKIIFARLVKYISIIAYEKNLLKPTQESVCLNVTDTVFIIKDYVA